MSDPSEPAGVKPRQSSGPQSFPPYGPYGPYGSYGLYGLCGLLLIGLGTLVVPLDSAVNIAFPAITRAFAIPAHDIQWIITLYVLSQSSLTIIFGKLGDQFGHRRLFLVGMLLSALSYTLCALASHYHWLVLARFTQGIGAGMILATGPALSTFMLAPSQKRRALAVYTTLFGLGLCLGPLIGGWLVQHFDWPVVFWMRVPIALLAFVLMLRLTRTGGPLAIATPARPSNPFDLTGAMSLALALAAWAFIAVQWRAPPFGWLSLAAVGLVGIIATRLLFMQSRRAAEPVLNLAHFSLPGFGRLQVAALLIHLTSFSLFLFLPYLLADWQGVSLVQAGIVLALFPAGTVATGLALSRQRSSGPRTLSSIGLIHIGIFLTAIGLVLCGMFGYRANLIGISLAMLATGSGVGIFQVGHMDATTSALPASERGVAGSIVGVSRLLGIIIAANGLFWFHEQIAGWFGQMSGQLSGQMTGRLDAHLYGPTIATLGLALALYGFYFVLAASISLASNSSKEST